MEQRIIYPSLVLEVVRLVPDECKLLTTVCLADFEMFVLSDGLFIICLFVYFPESGGVLITAGTSSGAPSLHLGRSLTRIQFRRSVNSRKLVTYKSITSKLVNH